MSRPPQRAARATTARPVSTGPALVSHHRACHHADTFRIPAASWYTNPQTEALCALLQIDNRINPVPPGFREAQAAAAEAAKVAEAARVEEAREAGRVAEDGRRAALAEAKRAALEMVDAQGEAEAENGDEVVVEDEEDE